MSVESLRQKSKTDHETAEAQLQAAREQTKQHAMDLAQQSGGAMTNACWRGILTC